MELTYDRLKHERNVRERGLSFERAREFDFSTAVVGPVFRNGEWRKQAVGYLEDRLHVLCFKEVDDSLRIISFRKANEKEAKLHGFALRR